MAGSSVLCLLTPGLRLAKQGDARELWGDLHWEWDVLAQKRCVPSAHDDWPEVATQPHSSLRDMRMYREHCPTMYLGAREADTAGVLDGHGVHSPWGRKKGS